MSARTKRQELEQGRCLVFLSERDQKISVFQGRKRKIRYNYRGTRCAWLGCLLRGRGREREDNLSLIGQNSLASDIVDVL